MIVECYSCHSQLTEMTGEIIKLTIDSDIGGGETIPITGQYHVICCRRCDRKQWLDVYGFTHSLSENPIKFDRTPRITNRGAGHAV